MNKFDVILQYCVHNDYPIFRGHIKKYRDIFNKIILYPSRHHGFRDFEQFSKEQVKETWVTPVKIDYGKEDWRQAETTPCLKHSNTDWIWFREQDFFVDNWDKFFEDVDKLMQSSDMFGWWNETGFKGGYVHPCCNFIKREVFEKTKKDFRAHPEINGCDHFAMLTRDVEDLGLKITKLQEVGYVNWENIFHLAGLTYPYQNWGTDRIFGVGNLSAFFAYNYYSRIVHVEQNKEYLDLSYEIEDYLIRHKGQMVNPEYKWEKFFI